MGQVRYRERIVIQHLLLNVQKAVTCYGLLQREIFPLSFPPSPKCEPWIFANRIAVLSTVLSHVPLSLSSDSKQLAPSEPSDSMPPNTFTAEENVATSLRAYRLAMLHSNSLSELVSSSPSSNKITAPAAGPTIRVYRRRWLMLLLFVAVFMINAFMWIHLSIINSVLIK